MSGLVADGRPLLALVGAALFFSGAFALFLSATGQFLPHDVRFLGFGASRLCEVADCRVVDFMFHDRVAFGGTLLAIGVLYLWLTTFPLARGEAWAWWTFVVSGALGFLSFLAYLAYGYLDTWHGVGTLFLLPCFIAGLAVSYRHLRGPRRLTVLLRPGPRPPWRSAAGAGRVCLLATAAGMVLAGVTILGVGMTTVFVAEDLAFMGVTTATLDAVSPRLIPLIAHDRAGFGGGLTSCGILVGLVTWCGTPMRSLWQALLIAGTAGFGCAIGIHLVVGYTDPLHLGPAVAGFLLFLAGIVLSRRWMTGRAVSD